MFNSMEKVIEDPSTDYNLKRNSKNRNPYHYKFYQEMWPDINGGHGTGGVDLPKKSNSGYNVEIKTTETHTFLLWDKDFAIADYFLCYDTLINTHFIVEKSKLPPVQKKCRSYRVSQIKKAGVYLPKDLQQIKMVVDQIREGNLSYFSRKEEETQIQNTNSGSNPDTRLEINHAGAFRVESCCVKSLLSNFSSMKLLYRNSISLSFSNFSTPAQYANYLNKWKESKLTMEQKLITTCIKCGRIIYPELRKSAVATYQGYICYPCYSGPISKIPHKHHVNLRNLRRQNKCKQ